MDRADIDAAIEWASKNAKTAAEKVELKDTVAAIERMAKNEADNIKRAMEIREAYQRPSQDALELAARARKAAEAQMDDVARARVATGLPAYGPVSGEEKKAVLAALLKRLNADASAA
jgi:hypothetical protein